MIQRRDGLGLAFEAFGKLRRRDFNGDITIQTRIASPIYLAHAARADGFEDLVGA
jgi:hypothetical protein